MCPVCLELVGGLRFAPHLEKCMNGGKRGGISRRKPMNPAIIDPLLHENQTTSSTKVSRKRIVENATSSHGSLIVRIKMENNGLYNSIEFHL
jgi:hypothetical protein